jgi:uncharacterized integral membrane protein (TIGR00698 family)
MSSQTPILVPWHRREDTWAIAIAITLVATVTAAFFLGASRAVSATALTFPTWSTTARIAEMLRANPGAPVILFAFFLTSFCIASSAIGWDVPRYSVGFGLLFVLSIAVNILGANALLKAWQLETPLLALLVGMVLGNAVRLPDWFQAALRTEFYVKLGIVLMGATLPFTVILEAGPLAILQATLVAVLTFGAIYFAGTRLFGLDERFAATLGAGGSICGVSAAIAIGGACRAEKSHVSVAISIVILWAIAMVFVLPFAAHRLGLAPAIGGAWIGTSEFADAAGFAASSALGDERAIRAFTLMKVVGRDMFVGVWAILVAFLSITRWDRDAGPARERVRLGEAWAASPSSSSGSSPRPSS